MDVSNFKLQDILFELYELAKSDGIITDEEKHLLVTFNKDIKRYQNYLNKAFEDDELTSDEYDNLNRIRNIILQNIAEYEVDFKNSSSDLDALFHRLLDLIDQHEINI